VGNSANNNIYGDYFNTGDKNVITYLLETFSQRAVVFAISIVKDEQEARDIVQKVFIKLWMNNLNFESIKHFKAYLYSSIRNACFDYFQSKKQYDEIAHEIIDESIEDNLIETEIKAELLRKVDLLPQSRKEVILLRLKGMTLEDIAKKLEVSRNTVKTHIRISNKELKESLKDLYIFISVFF